jgi:HPt (histidine-containing phosphotransfer) domain-containing protein
VRYTIVCAGLATGRAWGEINDMDDAEARALGSLDMLLQLCGGDTAKRSDLLSDFLVTADGLVASINRAFEAGETEELRRAAHSLKGSSPMYGAPALGASAAGLEKYVRAHGLAGTEPEIASVVTEMESTRAFLAQFIV